MPASSHVENTHGYVQNVQTNNAPAPGGSYKLYDTKVVGLDPAVNMLTSAHGPSPMPKWFPFHSYRSFKQNVARALPVVDLRRALRAAERVIRQNGDLLLRRYQAGKKAYQKPLVSPQVSRDVCYCYQ